jgi:serine/threonine protein kinase
MASLPVDRDLLFGAVAAQMNFIDRIDLINSLQDWASDTTRTLSEVLQARGGLTSEESTLVDAALSETRSVEHWGGAQTENRGTANDIAAHSPCQGPSSRYQILWAHAKGGLGEIFVAEDTELHRRVALKEIQADHARNGVSRERFIAEAEITGSLEHPGIVPVYGLGADRDGQPFYAMRFIKGEELATAIRRFHSKGEPNFNGLEFRWLLRKFIDVCNTVAFAHSRGVLHRDLKPGNIMIGPFGETLVMDWGVAKLFRADAAEDVDHGDDDSSSQQNPTPTSLPTRSRTGPVTIHGQAVGTPTYMSPEQAAGRLGALGPASDVYSLGATFYVMLTDRRPFQGKAKEVLVRVQEGQFQPPGLLNARVPKALDAICRRAMAFDPAHRYASALHMAEEIERWLADLPVAAWRDPWPDRARRWLRFHQPLVAGSAATVCATLFALVIAVPLLSLAWRNESTARLAERLQRIKALARASEARANEVKANEAKIRAEKALQFLVNTFRKPDPLMDGRTVKVLDVLDQAVRDLDQTLSGEPVMKATLLSAIAETFSGLGMYTKSREAFQLALNLRRENLGDAHPATLASMNSLGMAYFDAGEFEFAISTLTKTLEKRGTTLGDDHADTMETRNDLAVVYWKAGQAARAIPLFESAIEKLRASVGEYHNDTLTIMDNLAVAYADAGFAQKAIALHEAVIIRFSGNLGENHLTTLVANNNLARAYQRGGNVKRSIELYRETLGKLRAKLSDDHPTTLATMSGLALSYRLAGERDQSIRLFEMTLEGRRKKLGQDHPETLQTTFDLASVYGEAGQPEKAGALAQAFLDRTAPNRDRLPARFQEMLVRARKLLPGP